MVDNLYRGVMFFVYAFDMNRGEVVWNDTARTETQASKHDAAEREAEVKIQRVIKARGVNLVVGGGWGGSAVQCDSMRLITTQYGGFLRAENLKTRVFVNEAETERLRQEAAEKVPSIYRLDEERVAERLDNLISLLKSGPLPKRDTPAEDGLFESVGGLGVIRDPVQIEELVDTPDAAAYLEKLRPTILKICHYRISPLPLQFSAEQAGVRVRSVSEVQTELRNTIRKELPPPTSDSTRRLLEAIASDFTDICGETYRHEDTETMKRLRQLARETVADQYVHRIDSEVLWYWRYPGNSERRIEHLGIEENVLYCFDSGGTLRAYRIDGLELPETRRQAARRQPEEKPHGAEEPGGQVGLLPETQKFTLPGSIGEATPVERSIATAGRVEWSTVAAIYSAVSGRVRKLMVEEGQQVEQGEVMAVIEPETDHAFRLSEKTISVKRLKILFTQARKEWDRLSGLYGKGEVPREKLEEAEKARDLAKRDYERASTELGVLQEGAASGTIREDQGPEVESQDHEVRAPFAGVVLQKKVEEGDLVLRSSALFQVGDPRKITVCSTIPESISSKISVNMPVTIFPNGSKHEAYEGRIERIVQKSGSQNEGGGRYFGVEVIVLNPDSFLKPGMFVRFTVDTVR